MKLISDKYPLSQKPTKIIVSPSSLSLISLLSISFSYLIYVKIQNKVNLVIIDKQQVKTYSNRSTKN